MDSTHIGNLAAAFFVRMFRPVARIMLRYGISFRELSELCKDVYVDVASAEYGLDGAPASVSSVALLTGMTRRDVRNVRARSESGDEQEVAQTNSAARVLAGWFQDPEFADAGRPLPLPESGASPCFADLAKRYAPDIPVSTTLKALRSAGSVVDDEHGMGLLVARSRYYMPGSANPAAPGALARSGSVFEDLGNTVAYNLARGADDLPRFERRAANIHLDTASVGEFRDFANAEGQAFLERVDAWLSDHETRGDDDSVRVGLGMYWIEDAGGGR